MNIEELLTSRIAKVGDIWILDQPGDWIAQGYRDVRGFDIDGRSLGFANAEAVSDDAWQRCTTGVFRPHSSPKDVEVGSTAVGRWAMAFTRPVMIHRGTHWRLAGGEVLRTVIQDGDWVFARSSDLSDSAWTATDGRVAVLAHGGSLEYSAEPHDDLSKAGLDERRAHILACRDALLLHLRFTEGMNVAGDIVRTTGLTRETIGSRTNKAYKKKVAGYH